MDKAEADACKMHGIQDRNDPTNYCHGAVVPIRKENSVNLDNYVLKIVANRREYG